MLQKQNLTPLFKKFPPKSTSVHYTQAFVCWSINLSSLSETNLHMQSSSSQNKEDYSSMSTSSGANNTIEDDKLESQVLFPHSTRRPLPFSTSFGSEGDSDDPLEAIHAVSAKLDYNSRLIHSWQEKCVEDEAILADLNIRVNKAFSQKNKYLKLSHQRKLKAEELDTVTNDEMKGCLMNHMRSEEHHSELELAFNEGFDKFRAFAATTHTSYDWNYVSPDAVREILDDGGDMNEHNHVKAARKKPTDPSK